MALGVIHIYPTGRIKYQRLYSLVHAIDIPNMIIDFDIIFFVRTSYISNRLMV